MRTCFGGPNLICVHLVNVRLQASTTKRPAAGVAEMGGVYATHRREDKCIQSFCGKIHNFEDLGVGGMIILKRILRNNTETYG
jgi:hypothetical protein